ncbi:MAG: nucleotide exchange factor GrpE [bacterium]|nr:nucleotide exchange factor GrpE [bacterium]
MEEQNENKIEECEKLRDEYLAGWQRAKADFLNYKKDEITRMGELMNFAKAQWILSVLPIVDNWERALLHTPENLKESEWVRGIKQIESQLKDFLKSEGVEEIKTNGEKFNPEFHEAIEEEKNDSGASGEILEVLEKGYTLNGKLIRPAKVKIIK